MLLNSNNINDKILQKAYSYFSVKHIQHGLSLLNLGSVSVSFKKGTVDRYLIITGLCHDKGSQESKVVYKKRLEEVEGANPLTSNCTCDEWTEEGHCSHSAALFLLSLLEDSSQDSEQVGYVPPGENQEHRPPPHLGVGVEKFGTIIKSPSKLINSSQNPPIRTSITVLLVDQVLKCTLLKSFQASFYYPCFLTLMMTILHIK